MFNNIHNLIYSVWFWKLSKKLNLHVAALDWLVVCSLSALFLMLKHQFNKTSIRFVYNHYSSMFQLSSFITQLSEQLETKSKMEAVLATTLKQRRGQ